jgi:tetratricopeptide (TPR) repeat protein
MIVERTADVQQSGVRNSHQPSKLFLYPLFFFLIFTSYFNSFYCDWHLDDIQNILLNQPLHLTDLSNDSLKQTFFAHPYQPGRLLRPVSNFSFALNWFFGQGRVFGYHVVNFAIHFIAALFLYQSCLLLLTAPGVRGKYHNSKFFIAALSTILWAINPIQTQAVTYIVQRMAALAALFSIIGIWCYLKARLTVPENRWCILYYFGAFLTFLLAVGSKENAVLFPASLLLIEFFFFQQKIRKQTFLYALTAISLILVFTLILKDADFFINIIQSYQNRAFTLWQRVLTQPRVIFFYISLLLYPSPLRLSITHDVQISTSLFSPYTTLPAILLLIVLVSFPFFLYKKKPLFSFAIAFFLLNHLVESTILSLELVFEHRNYLPSFFFFLPIAGIINTALEKYRKRSTLIYKAIFTGIICLLILLSLATILRNSVWRTDTTLWTDSLIKAPQSARSYINLAYNLQYEGSYQRAFELYHLSLNKYSPTPWKDRVRAYNGMADIMRRTGNYEQTLSFLNQALAASKDKTGILLSATLFRKSQVLWLNGQKEQAIKTVAELVNNHRENGKHLQFYGELLLAVDKKQQGIKILRKALAASDFQSSEYRMALLNLALAYTKLGSYDKVAFYIQLAKELDAPEVPTLLCLLEYYIHTDKVTQAEYTFDQLLGELTWTELMTILERTHPDYSALPLSYSRVRQYTSEWLANRQTL